MRTGLRNLANTNVFTALTMAFVVMTFGIKAITDAVFVAQDIDNVFVSSKYLTALLACFAAIVSTRGKEACFTREFSWLLLLFAVFTFISLVEMLVSGVVSMHVFNELFKLGMPVVFAYFVLNALNFRQITLCMKLILLVSIAGYLIEVNLAGATLSDVLDTIDFSASYSPLESSYSAGTSIMLCLFFCYYRKNKICMLLSVIFCVAVFKRLALVFAIVAVILPFFVDMKKNVPTKAVGAITVLFVGATALYVWLLLPEQNWLFVKYLGQDQYDFSMGRSMTMNYLLDNGFASHGFGSASEVIRAAFGMPFEMDFIKVAIELTPIATVLLIFVIVRISSCNRWGLFMAIYLLLNMLTSDSLSSNFSLALFYMSIGCIGDERAQELDSRTREDAFAKVVQSDVSRAKGALYE